MGNAARHPVMSPSDFLAWEALQRVKHEFVDGCIYAMAGATEAHVTLTLNIAMALRQHLQGSKCRTLMTDMKLRVDAANAYFYPDVMVTCSEADTADRLVKREPVLVVEVLSPGTEAYDRGEKFAAYRLLPSLREYVLIDLASRRCDVFRKGEDGADGTTGLWVLHPGTPEDGLRLGSVELAIPPVTLWAEVPEVEPTPPPPEGS